jgi:hypothetical protein
MHNTRRLTHIPHTYDGFLFIFTHDGSEGVSTHDGLGRAALVRRFKILKPSHKEKTTEVCDIVPMKGKLAL